MADGLDVNLGSIGALLGSAAYFSHLLVNGMTLGWPTRPHWVAWLMAMVTGTVLTFLLAIATMPSDAIWTLQTYARIVLVGLGAGGAAAGASVTQTSAEATRKRAMDGTEPEPDPLTPQPRSESAIDPA
ncbi:MAG TPA: hypothetical protein VLA19_08005 [Herpetosiphonaceae bacterium]|nr:hypothetical protein [Herpetosiphonaceae bacterium]